MHTHITYPGADSHRRRKSRWLPACSALAALAGLHAQDRSTTSGGIVGMPYALASDPQRQITFKLRIEKAPPIAAYFYAMQFSIAGSAREMLGYTGHQPRQPRQPRTAKALFSIWGDAHSSTSGCHSGPIGLQASQTDFIEYYTRIGTCRRLPATAVVIDPPIDENQRAATLSKPAL